MIIRHDVDDQKYLDFGEKYSSSVAYIGGGAGTLVNENWILTAAHCVAGRECAIFSVQHLGTDYRVESIISHPKFNLDKKGQHDIALVHLREPVKNGKPVKCYRLDDEKGKQVVFVGRGTFGNGQEGLIQNDGKQRGATNTILQCSEQWIEFLFDDPATATELEGISGRGDSGGPALITLSDQLYVVGVSSYQNGNGNKEGTYGVSEFYTRVSSNTEWIESVMSHTEKPSILPSHPIIDAIVSGDQDQFNRSRTDGAVMNEAVLRESFYQTVVHNRVSMAEALITQGAEVGSLEINNASLFELAIFAQREDYFEMLLKKCRHCKNIHKAESSILPLYVSVLDRENPARESVQILLDQGANINAVTRERDTALILAGWLTNDVNLVRLLLEYGADVNMANENGDTAIIDAAYKGKNEILKCLLEYGADINVRNNAGLSALDMARDRGHSEAINMLVGQSGQ